MRARLIRVLLGLLLLGSATARAAPLQVRLHGNETVLDPVLLRELELPAEGPATLALARQVTERLQAFYDATGYDLARVHAFENGDTLEVLIDEGRLEKIVFLGTGDWKTFTLRLELDLPGDVFNQRQLDAELARLRDRYGFAELRGELVEVEPPESAPLQITPLLRQFREGAVLERWLRRAGRYVLYIRCVSGEWGGGLGYGLSYRDPYGLEVSLQYANDDLLGEDDRYRLHLAASAWTQASILSGSTDVTLTHAVAGVRYATPALLGDWLRPELDLQADIYDLQRRDLGIDRYWRLLARAALHLNIEPWPEASLGLGAGYAFEGLFDLETRADAPAEATGGLRHLPYLGVRLNLLLEAPGLRRDKHHELSTRLLYFEPWERAHLGELALRYQKVFELGYEDLFFRLRGGLVWGPGVRWPDELSLSSSTMRAAAGPAGYARKLLQGGLEFRLSLYRDVLKLSVFGDAGVFGEIDRATDDESLRSIYAVGPGAHVLVLDTFQLDVYYAFGIRDDGLYEGQFNLSFAKVY